MIPLPFIPFLIGTSIENFYCDPNGIIRTVLEYDRWSIKAEKIKYAPCV